MEASEITGPFEFELDPTIFITVGLTPEFTQRTRSGRTIQTHFPRAFVMMIFRLFKFGFCLLASSLFLTSSVSADGVETVDQADEVIETVA